MMMTISTGSIRNTMPKNIHINVPLQNSSRRFSAVTSRSTLACTTSNIHVLSERSRFVRTQVEQGRCLLARLVAIRSSEVNDPGLGKENIYRHEQTSESVFFVGELGEQVALAAPLCVSNVLRFLITIVSVAFLGRLGPDELAASALGTSFFNVTLFSVMIGLANALDTLCTQAFGAGDYVQMSYVCQRTFLIQMVFLIPLALLNWEMERVLLLVGQSPVLAAKAAPYTRLLIVSALIQGASNVIERFLQAQGLTQPVLWSAVAAIVFHMVACWTFIRYLGNLGAPIAIALSNLVVLVVLWVVAARSPAAKHFPGWSLECLRDWRPVLALALPSLAMLSVEWWTYEFMILLAGRLAEPALKVDASIVCFSVIQLSYALPYGLAGAAATRVGTALGAGRSVKAQYAAYAAVVLALIVASLSCAITYLGADVIGRMFLGNGIHNVEARVMVAATLPLVAFVLFFDGIQGTLSGVIRASGRQALGTGVNVVAYVLLALPLAFVFGFHFKLDIYGLWTGMLAGVGFQAMFYMSIVYFTNWSKVSEEASVRISENRKRSAASQERLDRSNDNM